MHKSLRKSFYLYFLLSIAIIFVVGLLGFFINKHRFDQYAKESLTSTVNMLDESIATYRGLLREKFSKIEAMMVEGHAQTIRSLQDIENPSDADLQKMKKELQKKLGNDTEINLINSSYVIYQTTYPPEKGLDLGEFPDARVSLSKAKESGELWLDFPIFEPAGKVFRAYSHSYIKNRDMYVQLAYKLSDFDDLNDILRNAVQYSHIISHIDIYLVHRETDGRLSLFSFTDFSAGFSESLKNNVLRSIEGGTPVETNYVASGRNYREFFKLVSKEGERGLWYKGIEHFIVYRLRLDLTEERQYVSGFLLITLIMFMAMTAAAVFLFIRFSSSFLSPFNQIIARMKTSDPVDPGNMADSYDEVHAIVETYNSHITTINKDREDLNRYNAELADRNKQLQDALNEIRTLRGILPICSACKSIRSDQGYWKQLEEYMSENLDISFTHGICPDCLKKHYPSISEAILNKILSPPDNKPEQKL